MRVAVSLSLSLFFLGCGHVGIGISPEFRTDAKYAFNLLSDAEIGQPVLKTDVVRILAKLDAEANTDDEKEIVSALGGYSSFMDSGKRQRLMACKATYELLMGQDASARFDYPKVTRKSCSDAWDENTKEIVAQVERDKEAEQIRAAKAQKEAERVRAIIPKMRPCAGELDYDCRDGSRVRGRVVAATQIDKSRSCITNLDTGCTDEKGVFHPMGRPR